MSHNSNRLPVARIQTRLGRVMVPSRAVIDAKSREIDRKLDLLEQQAKRIRANMAVVPATSRRS